MTAQVSVPARKVHPLLYQPPPPLEVDGWDEDDRFGPVEPDQHLFRSCSDYDQNGSNTKNPKGYIEGYRPQTKTRDVIRKVKKILEANADYLPMTVRQVFYRMVAEHGWEKDKDTELYDVLKNMRRAKVIPFDAIRDDGIAGRRTRAFDGVPDFWDNVKATAAGNRRDRQQGQDYRLELWCEASGMVPQLAKIVEPYSVPVYSGSGFPSLTAVRQVVDRVLSNGDVHAAPTVLLHVGDFDPSGQTMFDALTEDVGRFVAADRWYRYRQEFYPVRVALTLEQIDEHDLIRNPFDREKAKRNRHPHVAGWEHDFTVQAEALPPATLAEIVEAAIVAWMDQDVYQEQLAREVPEKQRIQFRFADVSGRVPE